MTDIRREVRRAFSSGDGSNIVCPVAGCDCEYVHPESVEVNAGGSITTVDNDGTRMKAGTPDGRGGSIRIGFFCEWGHRFSARLHFHKGNTSVEIIDGPGYDPEADPCPKTLWRD